MPEKALVQILSYLPVEKLAECRKVSKEFNNVFVIKAVQHVLLEQNFFKCLNEPRYLAMLHMDIVNAEQLRSLLAEHFDLHKKSLEKPI